MKCSKEKAEAIKALFAQILELNEKFEKAGKDKEIQFELNGGTFPNIIVRFWDWEAANNPVDTFEVTLEERRQYGRKHCLSSLAQKVNDWGERFGTSEKENGRAV